MMKGKQYMEAQVVQELVKAIPVRKSVRTFKPVPLPEATVNAMKNFVGSLDAPFQHDTRFELFTVEPGKKLYNNGVSPVNNLAMLAETDLISVSKAGFAGELVMLYAVSLGLATCWFGHYNLAELGHYIQGVASPEQIKASTLGYGFGRGVDVGVRAICCMPFGHRNEKAKRFVDFVATKNGAKRKPLEQLMESPGQTGNLPTPIRAALDLARLAPSAANSQFWRFGVSEDEKRITVAKPVGYRHFKWEHPDVDIGMCAAHIWLGLVNQGRMPKIEIKLDQDRVLWSFAL